MFLVSSGAVEGRIDATAYKPVFNFASAHFEIQKLSNVAFINPKTSFEKLDADSEVSFVPMEAIDEKLGVIPILQRKNVKDTKGFTRFQEDDLIWAKITPCMQNGKSAIVRKPLQGFACGSTEFYIIRPKTEQILVEYLHILLRDARILDNAQNFFGGSAGQQRVSIDFLRNLKIPLPDLPTQAEIVRKYNLAYQAKQAKEKQASELLAGIDSYLLDKLGIQNPQGFENLAGLKPYFIVNFAQVQGGRFDPQFYQENLLLPSSFIQLKEVAKVKGGKRIPKGGSYANSETGYWYLKVDDILPFGEIDYENIKHITKEMFDFLEHYEFKQDDIAVSNAGTIGKVCTLKEPPIKRIILTENCAKIIVKKDTILPDFLSCVLQLSIVQKQMKQAYIQTTIPKLSLERIEGLKIPKIPPLSLQHEIAEHISAVRRQAKELEAQAKAEIDRAKTEIEGLILGNS